MLNYSVPSERWQRVINVAVERANSWRTTDLEDRGAAFYASLRESLRTAGATDYEIGLVAIGLVWCVLIETTDLDERAEQFDLIGEHLALAEMSVTLQPRTGDYRVEFLGGAKVH